MAKEMEQERTAEPDIRRRKEWQRRGNKRKSGEEILHPEAPFA